MIYTLQDLKRKINGSFEIKNLNSKFTDIYEIFIEELKKKYPYHSMNPFGGTPLTKPFLFYINE